MGSAFGTWHRESVCPAQPFSVVLVSQFWGSSLPSEPRSACGRKNLGLVKSCYTLRYQRIIPRSDSLLRSPKAERYHLGDSRPRSREFFLDLRLASGEVHCHAAITSRLTGSSNPLTEWTTSSIGIQSPRVVLVRWLASYAVVTYCSDKRYESSSASSCLHFSG